MPRNPPPRPAAPALGPTAVWFVLLVGAGTLVLHGIHSVFSDRAQATAVAKLFIAAAAAACVLLERARRGTLSPSRTPALGLGLGALAILAHVGEFKPGPRFVHFWDQYHYYLGARYFPELGYSNFYRCALVAEAELGTIETRGAQHGELRRVDLAAEARDPERRIRNIESDNLLARVTDLGILEHPELCKQRFTPERWEAYKADIQFFRVTAGKAAWADMQKDHGFNPPPVWMIAGRLLVGDSRTTLERLQLLALIDVAYLAGMFMALGWAFGWRVCAVAAITWGCQAAATFLWTAGAFLRQDWLFFTVLSVCLMRKRYFALSGASLAYAALLRVFPALFALGGLTVMGAHLWRHRRLASGHVRVLAGAAAAAGVLVSVSLAVCGPSAYHDFAKHTLGVHNRTWTSNLMGTSIVVAYGAGLGKNSGRLEEAIDRTRVDASEAWRVSRTERFHEARLVASVLAVAGLLFFVWVVCRIRSLWLATCLSQLSVVLLVQIACYYYAFLVLAAPVTRVRRQLELPLFMFLGATQVVSLVLPWPDDRYAALSLLASLFCAGLLAAFARRRS